MSNKVLLTSVCRPLGPKYGDAPSVGYELLYGQVTRAQGLFSPRAFNIHFSLEYIAENLDAPTVVLQYPSKSELIRELKKGYLVSNGGRAYPATPGKYPRTRICHYHSFHPAS